MAGSTVSVSAVLVTAASTSGFAVRRFVRVGRVGDWTSFGSTAAGAVALRALRWPRAVTRDLADVRDAVPPAPRAAGRDVALRDVVTIYQTTLAGTTLRISIAIIP